MLGDNNANRNKTSLVLAIGSGIILVIGGIADLLGLYTFFQNDIRILAIIILVVVVVVSGFFYFRSRHSEHIVESKPTSLPEITKEDSIIYKGLLWKPTWLGLRYPIPLCPIRNCERPVFSKEQYPPQYLISRDPREMQEFLDRQGTIEHVFSCPIHGELPRVPNEHPGDLQNEAKYELKRRGIKKRIP
jgi:hypothetical protein